MSGRYVYCQEKINKDSKVVHFWFFCEVSQDADGRVISARAYRKGKERNNPEIYNEKRYIFDDGKIDNDINK